MENELRILGLITEKNDPSSRARILQYLPALKSAKINIRPRSYTPHNNTDPAPWMFRTGKLTGINPWRFLWLFKNISRVPLLYEQNKYDLIWQNRMIITHHSWFEKKLHVPRVFDFDDAIWIPVVSEYNKAAFCSLIFSIQDTPPLSFNHFMVSIDT